MANKTTNLDGIVGVVAAMVLIHAISPADAQPKANPIPGGRKGTLIVTVTATGSAHWSNTKGEKQDWTILRKAQIRTRMESLSTSAVDLLDEQKPAPPPKVPRLSASQTKTMEQLGKAMQSCKPDDQACMMEVARRFASSPDAPLPTVPQDMAGPDLDFTRYQSWRSDAQGQLHCGTGTASVSETMSGLQEAELTSGLWEVEGSRKGEIALPHSSWSHSCDTMISFDRKAGTYSLRIGGLHIGVPTDFVLQRKGMPASAARRKFTYQVLEHTHAPLKNYGLLVTGQKGTAETAGGSVTFPAAAPKEERSVSVTQRTVPKVRTTIEWSFKPD